MNKPPETKDLYSKEFLAEALKHKEAIDSEYQKIHKSFEKIAFNIYWIDDNCAYTTFGYSSIRDYAKSEHGISSSTCYDYINVVERFAERDKDGNITAKIADDYKDYGSSKLALICGLTDEEIRELDITPGTPARDIKKLLKSSPAKEPEPEKDRKKEPEPEPWQLAEKKDARSEVPTQEELPLLKNNDQRKEWLKNYKKWGLWYRDENIDVNYYKYDFSDGSRLIVAEYPQRQSYYSSKAQDEQFYHLLEKNKKGYEKVYDEKYRHQTDSETYLVEFLKELQKKG